MSLNEINCFETLSKMELLRKLLSSSYYTFGVFGSRDKARKTLSKIPLLTRSSFSSQYKSNDFVLQPKKSQTLGSCRKKMFFFKFCSQTTT